MFLIFLYKVYDWSTQCLPVPIKACLDIMLPGEDCHPLEYSLLAVTLCLPNGIGMSNQIADASNQTSLQCPDEI